MTRHLTTGQIGDRLRAEQPQLAHLAELEKVSALGRFGDDVDLSAPPDQRLDADAPGFAQRLQRGQVEPLRQQGVIASAG